MTKPVLPSYQIKEVIGTGTYGTVYRALEEPDLVKEVALKVFKRADHYKEEKGIYQMLEGASPYVIQPYYFKDLDNTIVFPYCSGKDFSANYDFLKTNLPALRNNAQQLIYALQGIHKKNLVHCDVKHQNILFSDQTRSQIRLADLGNAQKSSIKTDHFVCSPFYRPPEDFIGSPIDGTFDLWSLGCVLGSLYTGEYLFSGPDEPGHRYVLAEILSRQGPIPESMLSIGKRTSTYFHKNNFLGLTYTPKLPSVSNVIEKKGKEYGHDPVVVDYFNDFLGRCLTIEPSMRITSFQAEKHPFFTQTSVLTLEIPSTTTLDQDKKHLTLVDSTLDKEIVSFDLFEIKNKNIFSSFLIDRIKNHSYYAKIYSSNKEELNEYELSLASDAVITLTDLGIETTCRKS